jgi:hypothetical protein
MSKLMPDSDTSDSDDDADLNTREALERDRLNDDDIIHQGLADHIEHRFDDHRDGIDDAAEADGEEDEKKYEEFPPASPREHDPDSQNDGELLIPEEHAARLEKRELARDAHADDARAAPIRKGDVEEGPAEIARGLSTDWEVLALVSITVPSWLRKTYEDAGKDRLLQGEMREFSIILSFEKSIAEQKLQFYFTLYSMVVEMDVSLDSLAADDSMFDYTLRDVSTDEKYVFRWLTDIDKRKIKKKTVESVKMKSAADDAVDHSAPDFAAAAEDGHFAREVCDKDAVPVDEGRDDFEFDEKKEVMERKYDVEDDDARDLSGVDHTDASTREKDMGRYKTSKEILDAGAITFFDISTGRAMWLRVIDLQVIYTSRYSLKARFRDKCVFVNSDISFDIMKELVKCSRDLVKIPGREPATQRREERNKEIMRIVQSQCLDFEWMLAE